MYRSIGKDSISISTKLIFIQIFINIIKNIKVLFCIISIILRYFQKDSAKSVRFSFFVKQAIINKNQ